MELLSKVGSGKYQIHAKIGEGGLSEVLLASNIQTQELVALKLMSLHTRNRLDIFQKECQISKLANHPNIVRCSDYYTISYNDNDYGVLVLEKMDVDLMDYLLTKDRLSEEDCKIIFREVCKAVHYCHSKGIAHLDLKSDNILLKVNQFGEIENIKICDFGFAFSWDVNSPNNSFLQLNSKIGTKEYQSPECSKISKPTPVDKADVWSLGVILFSTITGLFPFIEKKGVISKIEFDVVKDFCKDDECYNLIVSIFQNDPKSRPSVLEILNHPWLQDDSFTPEVAPSPTTKRKRSSLSSKVKNIFKKIV